MKRFILLYSTLLIISLNAYSQEQDIQLSIICVDKDSTFLQKEGITPPITLASKDNVYQYLKTLQIELANRSFIASSVDSISNKNNTYTIYIEIGKAYKWAILSPGNVDMDILGKIGFRERLFKNKPLYYAELTELISSLQSYVENHGYPFAAIHLDSIQVLENEQISAKLHLDKKNLITYAGIDIIGKDIKISKKYLQHYLGIHPGEVYNLEQIRDIPKRIREIPFLEEKKKAVVTFRGSEATINLFLEKKKASKFDFLVGVLPRNTSNGNRLLITVDGLFATQNMLGAGERIHLEFRQVREGTQRLDLKLGYPYIAGMPFGVDGDFSLYKRDSTFLDLEYDFGLSYLFSANHYLKAFGHSKQSILLTINDNNIIQSKQLPDNLDTRFTDFGFGYFNEQLDYRFNPRKGWRNNSRFSAGFRSIKPNRDITSLVDENNPTFEFKTLYDSLDLRSIQYKWDNLAEAYIPIAPRGRGVIAIKNATGAIFSKQPVFLNEQYRLGGNRLLRGFDEESVNASLYSIFTLEYRLIIGKNSYIYLFGDYGYVESRTPDERIKDSPIGFGAGLTFDTPAGVFGISTAYGRRFENPIDFRAAKIHFGYLNFF